ncbi:MAG TPA: DivIVA domain-containing protein [Gaiellaceae bacterium]
MALTPVEIRHLTPPRAKIGGYRAAATDRLFEEIATSFEDVWRERADLADKVEQLETDLVRFRELESLLRTTLVSAEQASAQMRDQARREAELILNQAHAEAREVQRRALAENERLEHESRKLRGQLHEALTALGGPEPAAAVARDEESARRAEDDEDTAEERSWYGVPDQSTLPDATAA